jgi:two-component system, chemotaxis family, CheB/CheR fusion protein
MPSLRQRIIFSAHNILNDPPFTKVDLITCRNMLIYFQPATQERVLALFHFALRRGGCLFLGNSESLGGVEGGFTSLSSKHKLYRKITDSLVPPPEIRSPTPLSRIARAVVAPLATVPAGTVSVSRALLNAYDALLKELMPSSFLVSELGEIVQFFGDSSAFLRPPEGRSHDNLFNRTDGDLRLALSTVIPKAFKTGQIAHARGVRDPSDGEERLIDVEAKPVLDERQNVGLVLVVLRNLRDAPQKPDLSVPAGSGETAFEAGHALAARVRDLELQLHTSKENLQATVEELQSSNEELQATNEELLAANEELQSTNEELHSVNEELYTVNAEFERKNHELKTIGEDLNNLLASTDIGTLFLDRHLRIRRFTPAIARIFHLLPQDLGRPIDHLAYQLEGRPDLMQSLRDVLASGAPSEQEIRTRDGAWLFQRVLPFRTAENQVDGVVMTYTDISGVKSIQDKLNLAMEFSRMVWWEWDLDRQEIDTHTGGQALFGYSGAIVTTTSAEWYTRIHPEDRERVMQSLDTCLRGETLSWECQHRFLTRDGEWRWVVNKGKVAQRDPSGRSLRLLGTTQDVHERCLAEQEVRKLNMALERSPIMVMITDLEGRIEYVNQQFCDVTGYAAAEVVGQSPRILKSPAQPEHTFRDMWAALTRGDSWQGELCNRRKDGSQFWERATIAPLREVDGTVHHYVALKEEISPTLTPTDRQHQMEQQLSQTQKMETLGALASGIAHDFNNILTAIVGHTELASELVTPPHPAAESLQQVRQASRRAADLVHRILSFSRRGPSQREKLNLSTLVADIAPLLRASIPSTVRVDVSVAANPLTALANPTDLEQVILNLSTNAAHAMAEKGGILTVALDSTHLLRPRRLRTGSLDSGAYLRLRVSDTGSGIPPQVLTRMFEPFFTTKPAGSGTGLGLPIVLGIILAHGGAIDVETEVGRGTTFEVLLPAVEPDPVQEDEEEAPRVIGSGQRIAFVDDEPSITLIARQGLTLHGFSCTTFETATTLLDEVGRGEHYDMIITDQTMPGMTGLELIRRLREHGYEAPIIILSGNARFVTEEDLAGLGNIQFMPKPFELGGLLEGIAALLGIPR